MFPICEHCQQEYSPDKPHRLDSDCLNALERREYLSIMNHSQEIEIIRKARREILGKYKFDQTAGV